MLAGVLTLGGSLTALAEIPDMSVVIGKKSFSLEYANKEENLKEVADAMRNANGEVYIKVRNKWHDNYGNIVDKSSIQEVEYTSTEGTVRYAEHDGEIITDEQVVSEDTKTESNVLKKYLKEGSHKAAVYGYQLEDEDLEKFTKLTQKLTFSLLAESEWFAAYSELHKDKDPMPWDEKFGVTEEEYDFIQNIEKKLKYKKYFDTDIVINKNKDGKLVIQEDTEVEALSNFIIDGDKNHINLNYGLYEEGEIAEYLEEIEASKEQRGVQWNGSMYLKEFEKVTDPNNIAQDKIYGEIKIGVGTLEENSKPVIVYSENLIVFGVETETFFVVIFE